MRGISSSSKCRVRRVVGSEERKKVEKKENRVRERVETGEVASSVGLREFVVVRAQARVTVGAAPLAASVRPAT